MITIAKDGSGDFQTVREGIEFLKTNRPDSAPSLFVKNGVYEERLFFDIPGLCLEGESPEQTIITYHDYAKEILPDGEKRGTFRTPSVFIDADDVIVKNITFANTAGLGEDVGQALALYVDGDRIIFENCRMLASQDTVFTAPLPLKAYEPNGFRGPKELLPRKPGRHYYKKCTIRGDIDFIFGGACAFFEDCRLISQNIGKDINGYVTAASTPKNQAYGYVFQNCRFTGDCPDGSVYLGRPWRSYAKTVILNSYLGPHIHPEGWHDWNKEQAHQTAFYAEYQNRGEGAGTAGRPQWVHHLTEEEAAAYSKELVLGGSDGWRP